MKTPSGVDTQYRNSARSRIAVENHSDSDVDAHSANGMRGKLLIRTENGRARATYGVNTKEIRIMKFTFITSVILLSAGVRVSGDLEIFPGVQQEGNYNAREDNEDFFSQFYLDPRWRASIPWNNEREAPDYGQYMNPKYSHQLLEDFVNRRRQQLKQEAEKSAYLNMRMPPEEELEFRKLTNKNYETYQLKYPNQQILDDVRPYPHDDGDFSFRDGNDDEEEEEEVEPVMKDDRTVTPEASGKGALSEPKHLASEFAYAPPDPRFYEDSNVLKMDSPIQRMRTLDESTDGMTDDEDQIYLNLRNDKYRTGDYQPMRGDNTVEVVAVRPRVGQLESTGIYLIAIVAGISAAATVGLIAFAIGWYNLQKHVKIASDVEYPAYGVTGPNKEVSPSGDRRLAQSAQMYHYQHQKQQIIAMEKATANERHGSISEADSDEENEEGDYTVYECPGLAPTGEMEVKNPLFQDDPTPAEIPPANSKQSDTKQQPPKK